MHLELGLNNLDLWAEPSFGWVQPSQSQSAIPEYATPILLHLRVYINITGQNDTRSRFIQQNTNYRFFVSKFPVVRKPRSPIALRHSIESWPKVARPSFFRSFSNASNPSCWPPSCSTRKATWRMSLGFMAGRSGVAVPCASQLRLVALKGGLGLRTVFCSLSDSSLSYSSSFFFWIRKWNRSNLDDHRSITHILQLRFKSEPQ